MDKVYAIKRLAAKLVNAIKGTSYTADDFEGDTVVTTLKDIAVKSSLAQSTDKIKADNIVETLEYITNNYGTEENEPYSLVTTATSTTIVVTKNGTVITPADDILWDGDVLTITATPETDYVIRTLTVNGTTITSGDTVTVSGKVTVVGISKQLVDLAVTETECDIEVEYNGVTVEPGSNVIAIGDVLTITASAEDDYEMRTLTVNGTDFTSGNTHTVTTNVAVIGTAKELVNITASETDCTVTVTRDGIEIIPGTNVVAVDDVIKVNAVPDGELTISTLTINGEAYTADSDYTVTAAGVAIVAIAT